jgi:hypothetical protein
MSRAAVFSAIPENKLAQVAENNEKFAIRVLDEGDGHLSTGRVVQLVGGRLIAQVSECLKPNTCVRIERDDELLLGEVLGCWREGLTTFVAVQVLHGLTGLGELASLEQNWNLDLEEFS